MSYKITFSYFILISLTISLLFSEQIKNCPNCNNDFKNSYNYCPIDGKQLNEKETSTKDIDGFQNYKWGMSIEETKMIDKSLSSFNSPGLKTWLYQAIIKGVSRNKFDRRTFEKELEDWYRYRR